MKITLGCLLFLVYCISLVYSTSYENRFGARRHLLYEALGRIPKAVRLPNDLELHDKWASVRPELGKRAQADWRYASKGSGLMLFVVICGVSNKAVRKAFRERMTGLGWTVETAQRGAQRYRDGDWRLLLKTHPLVRYDTFAELWRDDTAQAPAAGEGER